LENRGHGSIYGLEASKTCGLRSHSQVEIQLGSLITLDLEISSVTIWGKVFPGIGALDSSYHQGGGRGGVRPLGWSHGVTWGRHVGRQLEARSERREPSGCCRLGDLVKSWVEVGRQRAG
jgi:hypothetical protein